MLSCDINEKETETQQNLHVIIFDIERCTTHKVSDAKENM